MTPAEPVSDECRPEAATPRLEDLIPIAVVISVGCEGCAESMVRRALRRGSVRPVIERTLGIVQQAAAADCLLRAVGPDVIARMKKALRAARNTL